MLVLSRKSPEVVVVNRSGGSDPVLKVTVLETRGGKVKLAFETGGIDPPTSAAETERQVVNVRAARCVRQAQQEARLYAESILATVREPLLVLDANLRVKTANRSFYQTFQVTAEDTVGRHLCDLGEGLWGLPALRGLLEDILPHHTSFHDFEAASTFPATGPRTLLLSACRTYRPGNSTDTILLSFEDVTRRRQEEAALKEADRNKDRFLTQLGHELRNLLAPLLNVLSLLRVGEQDVSHREEACALGERQVRRMAGLIEGLMDLAGVREGKVRLKKERLDLAAVVARAVETARPVIDERGHVLEVVAPPAAVLLEGDPARLEQIVVNLLTNAAKYTETGGRIRVAVERVPGEAVVRVEDTGLGLAPDMLGRIFDLYVQVAGAEDHARGGLGIGLCLVKRLAELHGGSVQVFSAGLGRGSEFSVRLPALPEVPVAGDLSEVAMKTRGGIETAATVIRPRGTTADALRVPASDAPVTQDAAF